MFDLLIQALIYAGSGAFFVALLGLFFAWLPKISPAKSTRNINAGAILSDPKRLFIVKLRDGERVGPLFFEGFVETSGDNGLPQSFGDQAVFRRLNGKKIFFSAVTVRMIEEVDAEESV